MAKRIADSTVRRLSAYLRFLEDFESRGLETISSDELAQRGGTTSAQVRKDLSFFGSFGKRGLGYSVPELAGRLREILGLGREWKVIIIGAGKIGAALAQYRGFRQRGFQILAAYDELHTEGHDKTLPATVPSLARVEWEHIQRVLADCSGNISQAAKLLGIHRRSLQRKLSKYPPVH